jgi:O-acetyl-ADP-ribose deacetylase (regulator of RNase III)
VATRGFKVGKSRVFLIRGDITEVATDALVNAANKTLIGGGGVDGAIYRRGGSAILEECTRIRQIQYRDGFPTGKAVITIGGHLKAKKVIHTVGPVWHGGNRGDPALQVQAYPNSLLLAVTNGLNTVAFSLN